MRHLLEQLGSAVGMIVVGTVVILFAWLVIPSWVLAFVGIFVVLMILNLIFVKGTPRQERVRQGLCPQCEHDLTHIGVGQSTCPNCGEAIPAPLRKWGSR